jgi:hypothetical protein
MRCAWFDSIGEWESLIYRCPAGYCHDHGVEKFVQKLEDVVLVASALWFGFGFWVMGVAELGWLPTALKCKRAKD